MMSRADQNWPDDETVEIPAEETEPANTGTLITDLTNLVEQAEKGDYEKNKGESAEESFHRDTRIGTMVGVTAAREAARIERDC